MMRTRNLLLATAVAVVALGSVAIAQQQSQQSVYDPKQLPETHGKVAQYSLTPRGDVDGVILDDGTEVFFTPRESAQLIFTVRPGDTVTVHGLKARVIPEVLAMSITNDATHQTVIASGPHAWEQPQRGPIEVSGSIKQLLHGPNGEVNGLLLDNGAQVRLPPPEAAKLGAMLQVGKPITVRGDGFSNVLGKLVMAREIGPDAQSLKKINVPFPGGPFERMMMMRGMGPHGAWGERGPIGRGPGAMQGPGGPVGQGGPGMPDGAPNGPAAPGQPAGPGDEPPPPPVPVQ